MPPKKRGGKKGKKGRRAERGGSGGGAAGGGDDEAGGGGALEGQSDAGGDLTTLLIASAASAAGGQPEAGRVAALAALRDLAFAAENKVPMWQRDDVQAVFVGGAAVDQPEAVRVQALAALSNLARAAENKVAMWQRDDVQAVLLGGAALDQPEAVRVQALGALLNFTLVPSLRPSLVQAGIRDLFDEARTQQQFTPRVRTTFDEAFQCLVGVPPSPPPEEAVAEQKGTSPPDDPCAVCGKAADNFCSTCKSVWYCCADHQREHWKAGHKQACSPAAAMAREGKARGGEEDEEIRVGATLGDERGARRGDSEIA